MKRRYIWLSLGVGLLLFLLLVHNTNWHETFAIIKLGNPVYLYIYFAVSFLILLAHSARWMLISRSRGIKLGYWKAVSYRYASFAVSFVTPGPKVGGEAVRASLLTRHKKKNGRHVRFSEALSTIIIDRAAEIQTLAILFFIGVLVLALAGSIPAHFKYPLILLSLLVLGAFVALFINTAYGKPLLLRLLRKLPLSSKTKHEISRFESVIVSFYRNQRMDFVIAHAISMVIWFLSFIEYKYLLLFLGFDVPIWGIFIIYSSVGLAYSIPVPLALGVLEGTQAATFSLLGLDPGAGVVLALITRLRDVMFTLIGFMILAYYGFTTKNIQKAVR